MSTEAAHSCTVCINGIFKISTRVSCAMTRLHALRPSNETPRAKEGDSLSNYVPGSQLVTPILSPVPEPAEECLLFVLFGILSQQFPHHNLCKQFIICQSFVKNECKKVLECLEML